MQDFKQLKVWEKAHRLTLGVYQATGPFPKHELFGLTSQLRRAATSFGANIAEGCCRGSDSDFCRFLIMALGSASEVEYELLLATDLGYFSSASDSINQSTFQSLTDATSEVKRMLTSFIQKLKADS
jgi:four helix bundle protein